MTGDEYGQGLVEFVPRSTAFCDGSESTTTTTENGVYADALETHGTWVFAGLLRLVNTHFHTEFFTQVATNTHSVSDIFIHVLYEPHQLPLDAKFAKSPRDAKPGYMTKCFFQLNKGHVQCLVDDLEPFL